MISATQSISSSEISCIGASETSSVLVRKLKRITLVVLSGSLDLTAGEQVLIYGMRIAITGIPRVLSVFLLMLAGIAVIASELSRNML